MSVASPRATSSAVARLADHVVGLRFDDIPSEVVEKAKDLLVYHLSLAFAGRGTEGGRSAVRFAHDLTGESGRSTIVGQRQRAGLLDAVIAHSALINTGQWHDFVLPSGLHPAVVTHPAAWVIGEAEHRSGKELIVSVVAGYDVGCKLGDSSQSFQNYARRRGYTFGPLTTAATAARLLGFDRETTAHAIGTGAHSGMGLVEGTGESWHIYPLCSRLGVTAALLAGAGGRTAERIIEGEHGFFMAFFGEVPPGLDDILATLGSDFSLARASTKRYPSSGMNIVPIERMLELARSGLRAPVVDELVVTLPEQRRPRDSYFEALIEAPDPTETHAQGSLRFQLALILTDGRIDLARYAQFKDAALQDTLRKVRLRYEPGHENVRYIRFEFAMRDGSRRVVEAEDHVYPKGDWDAWLREHGEHFLSEGRLARLVRLMTNLEDVDDVGDVLACTVPDRDAAALR